MQELTVRVPSPLSEMLLVMVLIANAIDSATRFVIVAYLKVGFAITRWALWLHRRYVLYPFFAALAVCVCAPWVHYQQTALRVANQRGAELALHVAALKNESERIFFAQPLLSSWRCKVLTPGSFALSWCELMLSKNSPAMVVQFGCKLS